MKLSILINFYDKDHYHIPNMLNHLSKLSFNKEVIFIDDRNDKSLDIRNEYNIPNEYKIINSYETGENIGTFEARRTGVLNATGEYVWFVDIDDEPLDFNVDLLKEKKELYYFNAIYHDVKNNKDVLEITKNDMFPFFVVEEYNEVLETKNNIVNIYFPPKDELFIGYVIRYLIYSMTFCVWDKLFKTDILKEMYSEVETIKNFSYGEDSFMVRLYIKYLVSKNEGFRLQISTTPNYIYNQYEVERYYFNRRYDFFSKEKIERTLSINRKFFKGTFVEHFTYLEDNEEEFNLKQGNPSDVIKHNKVYTLIPTS